MPRGANCYGRTAITVLRERPDFRRAYLANAVSGLGDSFQFVAVMWIAVVTGGTFGVIAVRLADGLPPLLLALHGGASADRGRRRRTMVAADLVRGIVLTPIAIAGLTGHLSIWAIAPAGFVVACASSYFFPAFTRIAARARRTGRGAACERARDGDEQRASWPRAGAIAAGAARRRLDRLVLRAERRLVLRLRRHPAARADCPNAPAGDAPPRVSVRAGFDALGARAGPESRDRDARPRHRGDDGRLDGRRRAARARRARARRRRPLAPARRDRVRDDLRRCLPRRVGRSRTRCGRAARSGCSCCRATPCSRRGRWPPHSPARSWSAWRPGPASCS